LITGVDLGCSYSWALVVEMLVVSCGKWDVSSRVVKVVEM